MERTLHRLYSRDRVFTRFKKDRFAEGRAMRNVATSLFFGSIALASVLGATSVANAEELESCGGIFLSAGSSCEFRRDQDCKETCEVVSVEESCTAELYTTCEAGCSAEASVECTETCSPVCVEQCTVAPEAPSSEEICRDNCLAECGDRCATAQNPACCEKACPHTCNKKCKERCSEDDQRVECEPKCVTACDGQCTATTNVSCQVECQTMEWESCQTTIRERCTTSCEDKGGAIFCDGEFLNASDLDRCAAELSAEISITLDVNIDIDTSVDTDGDGDTDVSCAMDPRAPGNAGMWIFAALVGTAAIRRRRQKH
jgi:hypothetical protein